MKNRDPGYATSILYADGIELKMAQRTVFAKIISNYTKIRGPKIWVKTESNKMRC